MDGAWFLGDVDDLDAGRCAPSIDSITEQDAGLWSCTGADPEIAEGGASLHVFAEGGATVQILVKLGVQIPIFKRKRLCLLGKVSGQGGAQATLARPGSAAVSRKPGPIRSSHKGLKPLKPTSVRGCFPELQYLRGRF